MNKVLFQHYYRFNKILRRFKSKNHWSSKKLTSSDRALEHFDDFYQNVFGNRWKSIRVALLSANKFCAVVNNFGDTEKTVEELEHSGAVNLRNLFELTARKLQDEKNDPRDDPQTNDKIYKIESNLNEEPQKSKVSDSPDLYSSLSLQSKLESAEYDESRIVDPQLELSRSSLYEYIPATKLKGREDWILESDHYRYYENTREFPVKIEHEDVLHFPEQLQIYSYEPGNIQRFRQVRKCSTGVLDKYLLDGGSVLPVLALDVKPGDKVLDMCAAPGGKSLVILQTLYPELLVCNELQEGRIRHMTNLFKQYLYDFDRWQNRLVIRKGDARHISDVNMFDKILVDVPCTTDRHAVKENDNNIFKPTRIKERLRLPEMQASILTSALKLVKPGGSVVYSTCSLSPIQNDGVVHMALKKIWEETNFEFVIKDLKTALRPTSCLYKIDDILDLKYGHLVIPYLPCNFGPMYFCKINRVN